MNAINNKGTIYIISIIPFILNDFSNFYAGSYEQWVVIDYASRLAAFAFLGLMARQGNLVFAELSVSFARKDRLAAWTLLLGAMAFGYYALSKVFLAPLNGLWKVSGVAYDRQSLLFIVDMAFGLVLVSLSEEIVFRGLALAALRKLTDNTLVILVASSLVFALIHWSTGLKNIVDCFVYGMFFMIATMRTKSILPAAIVHFVLDYYLLA